MLNIVLRFYMRESARRRAWGVTLGMRSIGPGTVSPALTRSVGAGACEKI